MATLWAIVGATGASVFRTNIVEGISSQRSWLILFVVACIILICSLVHEIFLRIDRLHLQSRLDIQYFPAMDKDDKHAAIRLYRTAREMIMRAREDGTSEILAVNWFGEMFAEFPSAAVEEARIDYHKAIEDKLGKVDYHRIVQYSITDAEKLSARVAKSYARHFREVIDIRKSETNRRVRLDRVEPRYPTSYVIIENRGEDAYLLWQLNEESRGEDGIPYFRPRGVLVVSDPEQQLIQHFKIWFNHLVNSESLRPLQLTDLGPSAGTESGSPPVNP